MQKWIGIDVSKATLAVCVMDEQKGVEHTEFPNTPKGFGSLTNDLKKRKAAKMPVCLEATGPYGEELAAYLHGHDYPVSVVNPVRIKRYAQSQLRRNKTDKLDAQVIADFCRTQEPPLWTPPDPAWVELRALVRHVDDLIAIQVQEKQRLESATSARVCAALEDHVAYLQAQIDQLTQQINDHIDDNPDWQHKRDLLNSISGISERTSSRLLAEIRDISVFETVEQFVAYVGLNPKRRQSGRYQGQIKISKMGNGTLRAALFMPARSAKRHNPLVQPLVKRMKAEGHCSNAITVAVMRKLLHYVYGVLKSGQPFDPHYLEKQTVSA